MMEHVLVISDSTNLINSLVSHFSEKDIKYTIYEVSEFNDSTISCIDSFLCTLSPCKYTIISNGKVARVIFELLDKSYTDIVRFIAVNPYLKEYDNKKVKYRGFILFLVDSYDQDLLTFSRYLMTNVYAIGVYDRFERPFSTIEDGILNNDVSYITNVL